MGQVGYPGDVGAITGYSSAGVAISEKVWLHYKGSYTFEGAPTTYVLRELLQVRSHKSIQPELNALNNATFGVRSKMRSKASSHHGAVG